MQPRESIRMVKGAELTPRRKIVCVSGTRPEAIERAPAVLKFKRAPDAVALTVTATAPHRQRFLDTLNRLSRNKAQDSRLARAKNPFGGHAAERTVAILHSRKDPGWKT